MQFRSSPGRNAPRPVAGPRRSGEEGADGTFATCKRVRHEGIDPDARKQVLARSSDFKRLISKEREADTETVTSKESYTNRSPTNRLDKAQCRPLSAPKVIVTVLNSVTVSGRKAKPGIQKFCLAYAHSFSQPIVFSACGELQS
jgi:hypothetical protein